MREHEEKQVEVVECDCPECNKGALRICEWCEDPSKSVVKGMGEVVPLICPDCLEKMLS